MKNNFIFLYIFLFSCSINVKKIEEKTISRRPNIDTSSEIVLKEKIAQMIMIRANGKFLNKDNWMLDYIESLVSKYKIGGLITFGGSVHGTFHNINNFQSKSDTPLFIAADYERGLGTFIDGTLFPTNMGIAATGDPLFSYKQGTIIAKEANAIGVNMILAPVVDINNNSDNPIINIRSYGDNKDSVVKYSIPFIKGIQDQGLIACIKHYPGHGNTATDSHTKLPIIDISEEELYNNELYPFKIGCENNVNSVMIGHILIPSIDADEPATFSKKITNDILRDKWNYKGLVITDALEMGALTSSTWHGESALKAIEAGADIILLPLDGVNAINSIYEAVLNGRISEDRINESYNRIIKYKRKINLYDKSEKLWPNVEKIVGKKEHLSTASEIAKKSITLVKNSEDLVPFIPYKYKKVIHLLLSTDNDLRTRMKPFVRDLNYIHGNVETIYVNDPVSDLRIKDILSKIKGADIVVTSMLIRISMDKGMSTIHSTHSQLLSSIEKLNIPVIGLSFGSPYLPKYDYLDAYLCSYGYGVVSMDAATNALFGRSNITGKLPIDLNLQYKRGFGIDIKKNNKIFESSLQLDLTEPISIIEKAIDNQVFPGAQIFVSKGENILYNNGLGKLSYDVNAKNVNNKTIYDVASLTKILATTPIIMKLVQKKQIGLNYPLSDFYPEFSKGEKKKITIEHLLTHTSGLKPYIEFHKMDGYDNKYEIIDYIVNQELQYNPKEKVVYSDLGMILLYDIIEKVTNTSFERLTKRYFYNPLKMHSTLFNPSKNSQSNIAPTEFDEKFRKRLLQGEVHDENAYLLGGVSGHAGLFSTAEDIGNFSKLFINNGVFLGRRYLKTNIIKKFTKRVNYPNTSDRAIGWDTPSRRGNSSAGDYFSYSTFGHLGFTGTSLWIDPDNDIIVVLLTNRVHPSRDKKGIYKVRRDFHNSLAKLLIND